MTARIVAERLPDLLGEHEADVLLDDLELRHVARAAGAEELDKPLDQLLGGTRTGGDPHDALPLDPLLAHLGLVVDQVRLGAVVPGDVSHRRRRARRS